MSMPASPIVGLKRRTLMVNRHLSGGVKVTFGGEEIILSPRDSVDFAVAVLKAVDVDVKLDGSMFPQ